MGKEEEFTTIRSLLGALAKAMNLINPAMEHHHEQTAYIAYVIAREMGMDVEQQHLAIYAALLHDVGSIIDPNQSVIEIEEHAHHVARQGASMLRGLPEYEVIADVIEYCQSGWERNIKYAEVFGKDCTDILKVASVVHLADTVALMLNPEKAVLNQIPEIFELVKDQSGKEYCEEAVDALLRLKDTEYIWLDACYNPHFLMFFTGEMHVISLERTVSLTKLMSRIIDYRSPFTAMHSAGVAASAKKLAKLAGMSPEDCLKMEIAGNLHDIGKLKVPREILEKPGKLTDAEFNVIKEHPYNTTLILMGIDGFRDITNWAGRHHEKLNGKGYPFHFDSSLLDEGARIMAVADIFSAITEERPYRKGMSRDQAMGILRDNVKYGAICGNIVGLLSDHFAEVDEIRDIESREAGKRYFASFDKEETA